MTLSRVERNDPALRHLKVSDLGVTREGSGYYWPSESAELARLGDAIGANTKLQRLIIRRANALVEMGANNAAFLEGINRNTSISYLSLSSYDLSGVMGHVVNEFVANNSILTTIVLRSCTLGLGNGGTRILNSALTSCTNLNRIGILGCNVAEDILVDVVLGIRGLHQLRMLFLQGENFGTAGCEALATLLRDPNGNLRHLHLDDSDRIDDDCAIILANALKGSSKLRNIKFSRNSTITGRGWDAFSQFLCDTSSVNATYLSNHTLKNLEVVNLPTNLSSLLELNRGTDKEQVATQKILRHHTRLDMEPFLEWDLGVLPPVVNCFDRARDGAQNEEFNVDAKKLSAIYQFAKAKPLMFVPPFNKATSKRKICEIN
eukprot:CAMPEP_0201945628 /NCGR_PEP_ID=MMETSP0903-20130614/54001_1 /ASSEMBLY_ACC=CAM_ASM_000552 /TAXON_ID=420261 /ORGANISM="Thalassiosira antarctica, Strain CCMP982" /LENGTH=375 /DNA_ID=CAMNT_0048488699 /DNA_START=45 /DNA_END=1172 /DNA_ORIENTATION=-